MVTPCCTIDLCKCEYQNSFLCLNFVFCKFSVLTSYCGVVDTYCLRRVKSKVSERGELPSDVMFYCDMPGDHGAIFLN